MRAIIRGKSEAPRPIRDGQKHIERPRAQAIYLQIASNARRELVRSSISLDTSGLAEGMERSSPPSSSTVRRGHPSRHGAFPQSRATFAAASEW